MARSVLATEDVAPEILAPLISRGNVFTLVRAKMPVALLPRLQG